MQKTPDNPNGHVPISDVPNETISCMRFSPTADFLAVTAWNNEVRVYRYDPATGQTQGVGMQKCERIPLWCEWSPDGNHLFTGGFDHTVRMWELQSNNFGIVGRHDAGVKSVLFDKTKNWVVSGGLDSKVTFWDLRQGKAAGSVDTSAKVFAMGIRDNCLCVALSDMKVKVFNTDNPSKPVVDKKTTLRHQLRALDCFPGGFAVASVEGRTAIEYLDSSKQKNNFSFKCHRQPLGGKAACFPVNCLRTHPVQTDSFATGGGDGQVNIWDRPNKQRKQYLERLRLPITSLDFDRTGKMLGYASSYDWHAGMAGFEKHRSFQRGIFLYVSK